MNDLTRLVPQAEGCSAVKDRFVKFAATFEAKLLSGNEELGNDMGKIIFMVKATDSATDSVILPEESIKQLEADKRMYKRQYLAFRHDGAHKKEKKSVFATEDDGLFDYERRIPRR